MKMRIVFYGFVIVSTLMLSSCAITGVKLHKAGRLSIVSTKNVNFGKEYALIETGAGFNETQVAALDSKDTKRKTKKSIVEKFDKLKAKDLETAVNNVISTIPGGVFLENVMVYRSHVGTDTYFVVSGDAYGGASKTEKNIRGFYVGCKALYKKQIGTIMGLIDNQHCLWRSDKKGLFAPKPEKMLYDDLIKMDE